MATNDNRYERALEILSFGGYVQWFKRSAGPWGRARDPRTNNGITNSAYYSFEARIVWDSELRDCNGTKVAGIGKTTIAKIRDGGFLVRAEGNREILASRNTNLQIA